MQYDLFENKIDRAIRRYRENEPDDESWYGSYYGAFSGGKDSIVIKKLAEIAGVKIQWHYNATGIDPPELVRFIKHHHPDVMIHKPTINMWKLIVKKRMPPTRLVRYCCEYLKEGGGKDADCVVTGVRRAESVKRSKRQSVECFNRRTVKGIVVKRVVNPIIDWTDDDVWWFIRHYDLPYCTLYDEGFKRLGCVGCPMAGGKKMKEAFERWPHFKHLFIRAFGEMLEKRLHDELLTKWTSAEAVFDWWVNDCKPDHDDKQISLFD